MDKPSPEVFEAHAREAAEPVRTHTSYARDGAIVLERSEIVGGSLTIGELIRAAKRFEDLEIKLVDVRLEITGATS